MSSRPEPPTDDHHVLYDAAIAAEQATGAHEPTEAAARSHLLVRLARMAAGFVLVVAGLAMVVLPGPGLLIILAGLSLLAVDVPFAARLRSELIRRADAATGFLSRPVKVGLVLAGLTAGVVASVLVLL